MTLLATILAILLIISIAIHVHTFKYAEQNILEVAKEGRVEIVAGRPIVFEEEWKYAERKEDLRKLKTKSMEDKVTILGKNLRISQLERELILQRKGLARVIPFDEIKNRQNQQEILESYERVVNTIKKDIQDGVIDRFVIAGHTKLGNAYTAYVNCDFMDKLILAKHVEMRAIAEDLEIVTR